MKFQACLQLSHEGQCMDDFLDSLELPAVEEKKLLEGVRPIRAIAFG
jgi:hypothetical protein